MRRGDPRASQRRTEGKSSERKKQCKEKPQKEVSDQENETTQRRGQKAALPQHTTAHKCQCSSTQNSSESTATIPCTSVSLTLGMAVQLSVCGETTIDSHPSIRDDTGATCGGGRWWRRCGGAPHPCHGGVRVSAGGSTCATAQAHCEACLWCNRRCIGWGWSHGQSLCRCV